MNPNRQFSAPSGRGDLLGLLVAAMILAGGGLSLMVWDARHEREVSFIALSVAP